VTWGSNHGHVVPKVIVAQARGTRRLERGVKPHMSDPKTAAVGTDWTQLLTDPDLVSHLGMLLQTYREAAPEKREQALIDAMRQIKAGEPATSTSSGTQVPASRTAAPQAATSVPSTLPPFEPDIFTPSW